MNSLGFFVDHKKFKIKKNSCKASKFTDIIFIPFSSGKLVRSSRFAANLITKEKKIRSLKTSAFPFEATPVNGILHAIAMPGVAKHATPNAWRSHACACALVSLASQGSPIKGLGKGKGNSKSHKSRMARLTPNGATMHAFAGGNGFSLTPLGVRAALRSKAGMADNKKHKESPQGLSKAAIKDKGVLLNQVDPQFPQNTEFLLFLAAQSELKKNQKLVSYKFLPRTVAYQTQISLESRKIENKYKYLLNFSKTPTSFWNSLFLSVLEKSKNNSSFFALPSGTAINRGKGKGTANTLESIKNPELSTTSINAKTNPGLSGKLLIDKNKAVINTGEETFLAAPLLVNTTKIKYIGERRKYRLIKSTYLSNSLSRLAFNRLKSLASSDSFPFVSSLTYGKFGIVDNPQGSAVKGKSIKGAKLKQIKSRSFPDFSDAKKSHACSISASLRFATKLFSCDGGKEAAMKKKESHVQNFIDVFPDLFFVHINLVKNQEGFRFINKATCQYLKNKPCAGGCLSNAKNPDLPFMGFLSYASLETAGRHDAVAIPRSNGHGKDYAHRLPSINAMINENRLAAQMLEDQFAAASHLITQPPGFFFYWLIPFAGFVVSRSYNSSYSIPLPADPLPFMGHLNKVQVASLEAERRREGYWLRDAGAMPVPPAMAKAQALHAFASGNGKRNTEGKAMARHDKDNTSPLSAFATSEVAKRGVAASLLVKDKGGDVANIFGMVRNNQTASFLSITASRVLTYLMKPSDFGFNSKVSVIRLAVSVPSAQAMASLRHPEGKVKKLLNPSVISNEASINFFDIYSRLLHENKNKKEGKNPVGYLSFIGSTKKSIIFRNSPYFGLGMPKGLLSPSAALLTEGVAEQSKADLTHLGAARGWQSKAKQANSQKKKLLHASRAEGNRIAAENPYKQLRTHTPTGAPVASPLNGLGLLRNTVPFLVQEGTGMGHQFSANFDKILSMKARNYDGLKNKKIPNYIQPFYSSNLAANPDARDLLCFASVTPKVLSAELRSAAEGVAEQSKADLTPLWAARSRQSNAKQSKLLLSNSQNASSLAWPKAMLTRLPLYAQTLYGNNPKLSYIQANFLLENLLKTIQNMDEISTPRGVALKSREAYNKRLNFLAKFHHHKMINSSPEQTAGNLELKENITNLAPSVALAAELLKLSTPRSFISSFADVAAPLPSAQLKKSAKIELSSPPAVKLLIHKNLKLFKNSFKETSCFRFLSFSLIKNKLTADSFSGEASNLAGPENKKAYDLSTKSSSSAAKANNYLWRSQKEKESHPILIINHPILYSYRNSAAPMPLAAPLGAAMQSMADEAMRAEGVAFAIAKQGMQSKTQAMTRYDVAIKGKGVLNSIIRSETAIVNNSLPLEAPPKQVENRLVRWTIKTGLEAKFASTFISNFASNKTKTKINHIEGELAAKLLDMSSLNATLEKKYPPLNFSYISHMFSQYIYFLTFNIFPSVKTLSKYHVLPFNSFFQKRENKQKKAIDSNFNAFRRYPLRGAKQLLDSNDSSVAPYCIPLPVQEAQAKAMVRYDAAIKGKGVQGSVFLEKLVRTFFYHGSLDQPISQFKKTFSFKNPRALKLIRKKNILFLIRSKAAKFKAISTHRHRLDSSETASSSEAANRINNFRVLFKNQKFFNLARISGKAANHSIFQASPTPRAIASAFVSLASQGRPIKGLGLPEAGKGTGNGYTTDKESAKQYNNFIAIKHTKQKKHRVKKIRKQNLSRKKRKRFYPRPIWLRYRNYIRWLITRSSASTFSTPLGLSSTLRSNSSAASLPLPVRLPSAQALHAFASGNGKRNTEGKAKAQLGTEAAKKIKIFSSHMAKKELVVKADKENAIAASLMNYTISNQIKSDLYEKTSGSLIKRKNLNTFLKRIKEYLNKIRFADSRMVLFNTTSPNYSGIRLFWNLGSSFASNLTSSEAASQEEYNRILYGRIQKIIQLSASSSASLEAKAAEQNVGDVIAGNGKGPASPSSGMTPIKGKGSAFASGNGKEAANQGHNKFSLVSVKYTQTSTKDPQNNQNTPKRLKDLKTKSFLQKTWIWLYNIGYNNLCWGSSFGLNSFELPSSFAANSIQNAWALKKTNNWFFGKLATKSKIEYKTNNQNISLWSLQKLKNQGKSNKTKYLQRKFWNFFESFLSGQHSNFSLKKFMASCEKEDVNTEKLASMHNLGAIPFALPSVTASAEGKGLPLRGLPIEERLATGQTPVKGQGMFISNGTPFKKSEVQKLHQKILQKWKRKEKKIWYLGEQSVNPACFWRSHKKKQVKSNLIKSEKIFVRSENWWFDMEKRETNSSVKLLSCAFASGNGKEAAIATKSIRILPKLNNVLPTASFEGKEFRGAEINKEKTGITIFYSLFFHFCTLISLISLYQIRSYIKFHFLILFKLSKNSLYMLQTILNNIHNLVQKAKVYSSDFFFSSGEAKIGAAQLVFQKKNRIHEVQASFVSSVESTKSNHYEKTTPPATKLLIKDNGVLKRKNIEKDKVLLLILKEVLGGSTSSKAATRKEFFTKILSKQRTTLHIDFWRSQNKVSFNGKKDGFAVLPSSAMQAWQAEGKTLPALVPPAMAKAKPERITQRLLAAIMLNVKTRRLKTNILFLMGINKFKVLFLKFIRNEMPTNLAVTMLTVLLWFPERFINFIIQQLRSYLKTIMTFMKNPELFINDFIGNAFLLEWTLDLQMLIPENLESFAWTMFSLESLNLKRSLKTNLLFTSLSLARPISVFSEAKNISMFMASPEKETASSFFAFPSGTASPLDGAALFHKADKGTAIIMREPFDSSSSKAATLAKQGTLQKNDLLISILIMSGVFQRTLSSMIYSLMHVLSQPDTDLILRQKKGSIYWDNWSEILRKAADRYNIIIPSLAILKDEQTKFMDILSTSNFDSGRGSGMPKGLLVPKVSNAFAERKQAAPLPTSVKGKGMKAGSYGFAINEIWRSHKLNSDNTSDSLRSMFLTSSETKAALPLSLAQASGDPDRGRNQFIRQTAASLLSIFSGGAASIRFFPISIASAASLPLPSAQALHAFASGNGKRNTEGKAKAQLGKDKGTANHTGVRKYGPALKIKKLSFWLRQKSIFQGNLKSQDQLPVLTSSPFISSSEAAKSSSKATGIENELAASKQQSCLEGTPINLMSSNLRGFTPKGAALLTEGNSKADKGMAAVKGIPEATEVLSAKNRAASLLIRFGTFADTHESFYYSRFSCAEGKGAATLSAFASCAPAASLLGKEAAQMGAMTHVKGRNKQITASLLNGFSETWSINQFVTYQSKDTDLFIDLHPPKSFSHISAIKYYRQIQQPLGLLVCSLYSGIFLKQPAKNILIIGQSAHEKTLLVGALAGETELKVITDNATRYALVVSGVAVGLRLLRDVFDALVFHTPCLFLLENIHVIGEKRPLIFSDSSYSNEEGTLTDDFAGSQKVEEQNKISAENSNHIIKHYKKPYKGEFSSAIPTNHFTFDLFATNEKLAAPMLNSEGLVLTIGQNKNKTRTKKSPIKYFLASPESSSVAAKSQGDTGTTKKAAASFSFVAKSEKESLNMLSIKTELLSRLQIKPDPMLIPPATSPLHVFAIKEQKKFQPKKIVKELPFEGLSIEQSNLVPRFSYSIRTKVALLTENVLLNMSVKLDMITDLLMILDSVRSNNGFIVFATTHLPSILDPALRRPGRLDETIRIPKIQNIWGRWQTLSSKESHFFLPTSSSSFFAIACASGNGKGTAVWGTSGFMDKTTICTVDCLYNYHKIVSTSSSSEAAKIIKPNLYGPKLIRDSMVFVSHASLASQGSPKGKAIACAESNRKDKIPTSLAKPEMLLSSSKAANKIFKKIKALTYFDVGKKVINTNLCYSIGSIDFNDPMFLTAEAQIATMYSNKTFLKILLTRLFAGKICESFAFSSLHKFSDGTSSKAAKIKNVSEALASFSDFPLSSCAFAIAGGTGNGKEAAETMALPLKGMGNTSTEVETPASPTVSPLRSGEVRQKKALNGKGAALQSKAAKSDSLLFQESLINKKSSAYMLLRGFQTLYGLDETWLASTALIFALIQKRYMFNKNLIIPNLLKFAGPGHEPESPPDSFLLMPAKRYENYKRAIFSLEKKSEITIGEKIQIHQQKRFIMRLYNLPFKQLFRSETDTPSGGAAVNLMPRGNGHDNEVAIKGLASLPLPEAKAQDRYFKKVSGNNHFVPFSNVFLTLNPIQKSCNKITATNLQYRNKILDRHRQYLSNQWWSLQLPEYNSEAIFLSDVDWRYTFIDNIGEFLIDYPDAEQISTTINYNSVGFGNSWFTFNQIQNNEVFEHFLFESFLTAFNWFDKNREFLDFSAYKYQKKGFFSSDATNLISSFDLTASFSGFFLRKQKES